MIASSSTSPTHTNKAAFNYDVVHLSKPKPAAEDIAPSHARQLEAAAAPLTSRVASASSALTYHAVVTELDSERWSFAPYPRCTRSQLLQVHTYWVMVPREKEGLPSSSQASSCPLPEAPIFDGQQQQHREAHAASATLASHSPNDALQENSAATPELTRFACVVGVVWVRLSSGTAAAQRPRLPSSGDTNPRTTHLRPLEGYLQVVLTHPAHRRRGLASSLLRTCLATTTVPANVFAGDAEGGQPHRVERWHLHTLMDRVSAVPPKRGARREVERRTGDAAAEEKEDAAAVAATLLMYRRLGFVERRHLHGYYAGAQDAVELVKQCR